MNPRSTWSSASSLTASTAMRAKPPSSCASATPIWAVVTTLLISAERAGNGAGSAGSSDYATVEREGPSYQLGPWTHPPIEGVVLDPIRTPVLAGCSAGKRSR